MTPTQPRSRVLVDDLHSWIPAIPPLNGEECLNAADQAASFLKLFSSSIDNGDWVAFEELFTEKCFWRDHLTLTFDKRTLHTSKDVAKAWKILSQSR
ncbi:flavin-containing monooxygenase, partial [Colletotrichum incanum]